MVHQIQDTMKIIVVVLFMMAFCYITPVEASAALIPSLTSSSSINYLDNPLPPNLYYAERLPKHLPLGSYDILRKGWMYNESGIFPVPGYPTESVAHDINVSPNAMSLPREGFPGSPTTQDVYCGSPCTSRVCYDGQRCCSPSSSLYCSNSYCTSYSSSVMQCCQSTQYGYWWNISTESCSCCSYSSSCCTSGWSCCGSQSGCCPSTGGYTCCGKWCCASVNTCHGSTFDSKVCCAANTTYYYDSSSSSYKCCSGVMCNGACYNSTDYFCCASSTICSYDDYVQCDGSECITKYAAQESNVNTGFIVCMSLMGFLVFVVLCRSRNTFKDKPWLDRFRLWAKLIYPFVLVNQLTLAAYLYVHGNIYFALFLTFVLIEFFVKNYFFFQLMVSRPPVRKLYKMLVLESNSCTYISGFAVMYLFPYIAYLDTVRSHISQAASTWETIMSKRRYIDLLFVLIGSGCYIINIIYLNDVATAEMGKSIFLLVVSLSSVLFVWWEWSGKRQRARDFQIHKRHLRDLADISIESTEFTPTEAEDLFVKYYVGGGSLIKQNSLPAVWYTETLFMIKGNRVLICVYDKREANYEVIVLSITAEEYHRIISMRREAAAAAYAAATAVAGQNQSDYKLQQQQLEASEVVDQNAPQWRLKDAKIYRQVDFARLREILSGREEKPRETMAVNIGGALSPEGSKHVSLIHKPAPIKPSSQNNSEDPSGSPGATTRRVPPPPPIPATPARNLPITSPTSTGLKTPNTSAVSHQPPSSASSASSNFVPNPPPPPVDGGYVFEVDADAVVDAVAHNPHPPPPPPPENQATISTAPNTPDPPVRPPRPPRTW